MRAIAGWLLLVSMGLLAADTFTAVRMASACCCAAMAGMAGGATCPLKSQGHQSCDERGRGHCSLSQSDANAGAQNLRAPDSREPSTMTETGSRLPLPAAVLSFVAATGAHPSSCNPLPETPPPRRG